MKKKARNSDSIKNESGRPKIRKSPSKRTVPKKQIRDKAENIMYVGIDLHKKFHQVAVMNNKGKITRNEKIENTQQAIRQMFSKIPLSASIVMESSSVWYGVYRFMTDVLGYKVVLSNPYLTKAIAASKKKTDKIDVAVLADLLRGGYITTCFVPSDKIVKARQLVRYRRKLIQWRTSAKNCIHGILLQNGIKIPGATFTGLYMKRLCALGDYRIDGFIRQIESLNDMISDINAKIYATVKTNSDAMLLKTIPGVGDYTALVIASEIGGISRFNDSHKLAAYAGVAPSVRNSADTIHHGRITKKGSMTLRWVLIEAAHSHALHAPNSNITQFYNRIKKKRGSSKAAVATGSKMLRVIYWMLKEKREFVQNYS